MVSEVVAAELTSLSDKEKAEQATQEEEAATGDYLLALMEAAKIKKGSGEPNRNRSGKVSWDQVKTIAEDKMVDLNAFTVESAMSMVAGTARSMGLKVSGKVRCRIRRLV